MTCASCASRVERKLNKLDGVEATVNYATERATVDFDAAMVDAGALVAAVEAAGYTRDAPGGRDAPTRRRGREDAELADLPRPARRRGAALACRSLLLAMIPPLQFDYWQWLCLQLATAGRALGRLAVPPRRLAEPQHGAATMDTLISLGTLAAWGWSVVALFFLGAGEPEMRMPFALIPDAGRRAPRRSTSRSPRS